MITKIVGFVGLILWVLIAVPTHKYWSPKRHYERMRDKSLEDGFGYGKHGQIKYHSVEDEWV